MSTAEEKKALGNKAFAAKKYDEAIQYYTQAIAMDPKNHVYYSNRSASYAGKKKWEAAALDAKECIKLEPSFLKGYYRLTTSQIELGELDSAIATVKQGLQLDVDNDQLSKLLRIIKAKKAAQQQQQQVTSATTAAANNNIPTSSTMDSSLMKEIQDLQDQLRTTAREFNIVNANIQKSEKEKKMNEITKAELQKLPLNDDHCKMYRGIGKMFMRSSPEQIHTNLDTSIQEDDKKVKDLTQKKLYLEKRMKSQQQNILELTKSPSAE